MSLLEIPTDLSSVETWPGTWFYGVVRSDCNRSLAQVINSIEANEVACYVPMRTESRVYNGKGRSYRRDFPVPMFPGYFFACLDKVDDQFDDVRRSWGVCGLTPIANQQRFVFELGQIQRVLSINPRIERFEKLFAGLKVEIVRGPFRGIKGWIIDRFKRDRVYIQIEEMSGAAVLDVFARDVEPIE